MKTAMIEIKPGDLVMETSTGRIGKLQNIKLTPAGINNPELCVILYVSMERKKKVESFYLQLRISFNQLMMKIIPSFIQQLKLVEFQIY